jgi:hypothetical protein
MKSTYDLSRAEATIADYLRAIENPDRLGRPGRTWLEFCMVRNGLIPDERKLGFGESHAIWYAALVVTKNVQRVSSAEVHHGVATRPATTARTIRRILSNKRTITRDTLTARMVREILEAQSAIERPRPATV